MNYLSQILHRTCNAVLAADDKSNFFLSDTKRAIAYVSEKVAQVATGVICGAAPHLLSVAPLYAARAVALRDRVIHTTVPIAPLVYMRIKWDCGTLTTRDIVRQTLPFMINLVVIADHCLEEPPAKELRIALDALCLLTTAIGSVRAIRCGLRQLRFERESGAPRRLSSMVSGVVQVTIGTLGVASVSRATLGAMRDTRTLYRTFGLDWPQWKAAMRHDALAVLNGSKTCRAVILDGHHAGSGYWASRPYPITKEIYRHCYTRGYVVENSRQFCEALREAQTILGAHLDLVSLQGHASPYSLTLAERYGFTANATETSCMAKVLSRDAQVLALGCNTAVDTGEAYSLAKRLWKALPGREVLGTADYYVPTWSVTRFLDNRFEHLAFYPSDFTNSVVPISVVFER